MKKRSRAHEAGSIEAGSPISKSIFFANRVDRAVVGSQIEPPGAPRSAQSSEIEPASAPGASRSSQQGRQGQPERANRGQIEPARPPRPRPGRARSLGWSPSCPRGPKLDKHRRAISLWISGPGGSGMALCPIAIHLQTKISINSPRADPARIPHGPRTDSEWTRIFHRHLFSYRISTFKRIFNGRMPNEISSFIKTFN